MEKAVHAYRRACHEAKEEITTTLRALAGNVCRLFLADVFVIRKKKKKIIRQNETQREKETCSVPKYNQVSRKEKINARMIAHQS